MNPYTTDECDNTPASMSRTPPSPSPSPSLASFASLSVPKEVDLTDTGTRLKLLGKVEDGMAKYLEAITVNPAYAPAYYNIAVVYSEVGRYEEALKYYHAAIVHNKFYFEAYCNIGVIYKNVGQLEVAISFYEKALAVNPNFTIAKNNMAIALTDYGTKVKTEAKTQDAVQKAIQCYQKALVYNFQYADAYYNLGVAYGETGEYDKAVVSYELAVHFNPMCCEAYNNLGVIYKDRDNLEKSIQCYSAALNVNPKFSQTLNNLGVVYTVQGKLEEAYKYVKAAINVNPQYAEAYNNLGVLYRDEGEIEKGLACYERCLEICPVSRNAAQNRLLAMNYLADLDTDVVFQAHKTWGETLMSSVSRQLSPRRYGVTNDENKVLNIGYMSADFFTHSVSYFIEAILAHHSRQVNVFCYSNVVKEDAKTQKLKQYGSTWRPIYGKGTEEVVEMIRADKIDILVELTGHTAANRLDVCLHKPAPIQVTYIGYPNTTGLPTIDYRFSDGYADPLTSQQQYTEELVRLPHSFLCYTPPSDSPEVSPPPCLKNGYITFGSFNNLAKINTHVLDLWADVMKKVPNSRLVVKCKPFASGSVKAKYLRRMEARGISSSRIDLYTLIGQNSDHLAAYSWMDISLDTFPYAGTTTTCESLWMGVPVVTLTGHCHAHNVGVSLLSNIGLQSLITTSKEEYVGVAAALASDVERLTEIRSTLRQKMLSSYLCDGVSFTANLEATYRQLWQRYVLSRNEATQQEEEKEQQVVLISKKHKNKQQPGNNSRTKKNKNEEEKENGDGNVVRVSNQEGSRLDTKAGVNNVNSNSSIVGMGENSTTESNSTDTEHGNNNTTTTTTTSLSKTKDSGLLKTRIKMKVDNKKKKRGKAKPKTAKENPTLTALLSPSVVHSSNNNARNERKDAEGVQVTTSVPSPSKALLSMATSSVPDNNNLNTHNIARTPPIQIPKRDERRRGGGRVAGGGGYLSRTSSSSSSSTQTLSPDPSPPNSPSFSASASSSSSSSSTPQALHN